MQPCSHLCPGVGIARKRLLISLEGHLRRLVTGLPHRPALVAVRPRPVRHRGAPEHVWGHADSDRIAIGVDAGRQGALATFLEEIGGQLEHGRQQPVADVIAVSLGAGGGRPDPVALARVEFGATPLQGGADDRRQLEMPTAGARLRLGDEEALR